MGSKKYGPVVQWLKILPLHPTGITLRASEQKDLCFKERKRPVFDSRQVHSWFSNHVMLE